MDPLIRTARRGTLVRGRNKFLNSYMDEFIGSMERYSRALRDYRDYPFYYRERALIGFVASGIWAAGGVCIEEYGADKETDKPEAKERTYLGRGDLYFLKGRHEGNVEFKMRDIAVSSTFRFERLVTEAWKKSCNDATKHDRETLIPCFAGLFLRPHVGETKGANVNANIKELLRVAWETCNPDAIAWWCPVAKVLDTEEDTSNWIVGVIMLVKRIPRRRRSAANPRP